MNIALLPSIALTALFAITFLAFGIRYIIIPGAKELLTSKK